MPIPAFQTSGVLPPYLGPDPGQAPALMSPYPTTMEEVVATFGTSSARRRLLQGLLDHRSALFRLGIREGFEWLAGSFLERTAGEPNDIDVVLFYKQPPPPTNWLALWPQAQPLLTRNLVKSTFHLDLFYFDLGWSAEASVDFARYLLQLFAHRRGSREWKGLVRLPLLSTATDDDAAVALLGSMGP